jgi:hypothetical protein
MVSAVLLQEGKDKVAFTAIVPRSMRGHCQLAPS